MYRSFEGEILLKETYGTTTKERYYVKPPDQSNVVVVEEKKLLDAYHWLARVFLPHGYPHTVSKDYVAYQIWDTAQAFCSTITGTLATQEVLRGVGVGDTSATPLAATITWVIKDGCGHIGRILFACTHGTHLDAYSKKWRLYADVLNDAAMCIEISLPLFRNYTTTALCVSTAMKAIVGVAGGATRAALTQHHALCGNMADVAAKDSAQETAVNLVASIAALCLITLFGNSVTLFLFVMVLHITFNYLAVRAVCLRTLNEPRYLQVIDAYLNREVMASPCEVNRHEPVVLYKAGNNHLDVRLCGFQIKMGQSLQKITRLNPSFEYLSGIRDVYKDSNYLLYPNVRDREMYVLWSDATSPEETLKAYFHAVLLSAVVCAINDYPLQVLAAPSVRDREMFVLWSDATSPEETLKAYFHAVLLSARVCATNDYPLVTYITII
ncbi:vitamin b6 photo-protection and homoeostasis domain-containing protein [Phthorimaea operculella]|nr:vitamin b6 photo-protection and homoeostasis domain-containing protein [Phthorimaea operculella]